MYCRLQILNQRLFLRFFVAQHQFQLRIDF